MGHRETIKKLDCKITFTETNWEVVKAVFHQDLLNKSCTKIDVEGATGWLELFPEVGSKIRFKSIGREPTVIDMQTKQYSCPEGMSTFKLETL